ncbi:glutathione S-transferase, C-terminal-like protein [Nitzschia inconspicua]|uniref:Glutathione S-transferase, C-terminal-like protein n=1 Tax=Nitzschia inconspicua TaxID=303405 RepID=A0A9K3LBT5_9STRA|nr:glutathione S-transferase, C-terminal-like protein [Nitzschia inconspicua]
MAQRYKLYSPPGSFRALPPLISAEYNGIDIEIVTEKVEEIIAKKSPTGKAPLLECLPSGSVIFSSHAIARYVAGLRTDSTLLGTTQKERMAIDEWLDWTACQVELPACVLFYPKLGYMSSNEAATQQARQDFGTILQLLETYLSKQPGRYLVHPQRISLADIVVVCTLLYPFQLACDPDCLTPYRQVVRWFQQCVQQPEFVTVIGHVTLFQP